MLEVRGGHILWSLSLARRVLKTHRTPDPFQGEKRAAGFRLIGLPAFLCPFREDPHK